jgi:hypothetical protein
MGASRGWKFGVHTGSEYSMDTMITRDILHSYLQCKYKGFLKLSGQSGPKSDYETLLRGLDAEFKIRATDKILTKHEGGRILQGLTVTRPLLKQGPTVILDAVMKTDFPSLHVDGLKRVSGASHLGPFHFVHGQECKARTVQVNSRLRNAQRMLEEIRRIHNTGTPPKLMLNEHCRICEFQGSCHGSYESAFLRRMRKYSERKKVIDKVISRSFNVLSVIHSNIYFPTYSKGLKDIGPYLGCAWTEETASGIQNVVRRKSWEKTGDKGLKCKLAIDNYEDCAALKRIIKCIYATSSKSKLPDSLQVNDSKSPEIAWYTILNHKQLVVNGVIPAFSILTTITLTSAFISITKESGCSFVTLKRTKECMPKNAKQKG